MSINYCGITHEGVNSLKDNIDNNENSNIEKVYLQGNQIGNKGLADFFEALSLKEDNLVLEEINVSNTTIGGSTELINSLIAFCVQFI